MRTRKRNPDTFELSLKGEIRKCETLLPVYIHILKFDLLGKLKKSLSYLRKFTMKVFLETKKGEYFIESKAFLNTERLRFRAVLWGFFQEITHTLNQCVKIWVYGVTQSDISATKKHTLSYTRCLFGLKSVFWCSINDLFQFYKITLGYISKNENLESLFFVKIDAKACKRRKHFCTPCEKKNDNRRRDINLFLCITRHEGIILAAIALWVW